MPAGRPRKEIDAEGVRKLAKLGCTNEEIGDFFGVSREFVRTRYMQELILGRAEQKISLRRLQFKRAYAGSDPMLIHLGKNYLGQADKIVTQNADDATQLRDFLADDDEKTEAEASEA